jgi:hypothetical protein
MEAFLLEAKIEENKFLIEVAKTPLDSSEVRTLIILMG